MAEYDDADDRAMRYDEVPPEVLEQLQFPMLNVNQPSFEEAIAPVVIMLNRIYDLLMIVADKADKPTTEEMVKIHTKGGFYGPPPGFDPAYQRELDAQ